MGSLWPPKGYAGDQGTYINKSYEGQELLEGGGLTKTEKQAWMDPTLNVNEESSV